MTAFTKQVNDCPVIVPLLKVSTHANSREQQTLFCQL